jgi:copper chaperone CopZ
MTCASCVVLNENSLKDLSGVINVAINLAINEASIDFDEKKISFEQIKKEVELN